jgi:hypothetical protein
MWEEKSWCCRMRLAWSHDIAAVATDAVRHRRQTGAAVLSACLTEQFE